MTEVFHHGALVSFLFAAIGIGAILKTYGHDRSLSISSHAAQQRVGHIIFLVSLILATIAFYLFTFFWLVPVMEISSLSTTLIVIALTLLVATAIIPDSGGRLSVWHGIVAWSMAVFLVLIIASLLVSLRLSVVAYDIAFIVALYMVVDWFIFLFIKKSHQHFLLFQGSYVFGFYVAIFAIAYIK